MYASHCHHAYDSLNGAAIWKSLRKCVVVNDFSNVETGLGHLTWRNREKWCFRSARALWTRSSKFLVKSTKYFPRSSLLVYMSHDFFAISACVVDEYPVNVVALMSSSSRMRGACNGILMAWDRLNRQVPAGCKVQTLFSLSHSSLIQLFIEVSSHDRMSMLLIDEG